MIESLLKKLSSMYEAQFGSTSIMDSILDKLSSLHYALFGSKKLLPLEQICLDAWQASLPVDCQQILEAQLASVQMVQRRVDGARVYFYFRDSVKIPLFGNKQLGMYAANRLLRTPAATVVLRTSGSKDEDKTMRVNVFVDRGQFFSIEFPKRPERYMQQHGIQSDTLQVVAVVNHVILN